MKRKVIHYCWFGKNPKPALIKKCMNSWKKFCPEYEIIEWNEDNFDINCCDYVREAYESKKWAFVSDYCRFYVLYTQGGIYLDTDVELLKSLNEFEKSFVGFESEKEVNSGLIRGADKGDRLCKLMLDSYNSDHFQKKDDTLNMMTVCTRETEILCELGMKRNNRLQTIQNTVIYPTEYFNPIDRRTGKIHITNNTVSIHHYAGSWESKTNLFRGRMYRFMNRWLGEKIATFVRSIFGRKK